MEFPAKVKELNDLKAVWISYMKSKIQAEDWHGVADAAMDLREIDAKLEVYIEVVVAPPPPAGWQTQVVKFLEMLKSDAGNLEWRKRVAGELLAALPPPTGSAPPPTKQEP